MEGEQEGMFMETRKMKSVEEFEREGQEMTELALTELEGAMAAHPEVVRHATEYKAQVGSVSRRSAAGDMVLRAAMLLAVLVADADVFLGARLPAEAYSGVNDVLGRTGPRLVAQAAVLFRTPVALVLLGLADVLLMLLYLVNESQGRLLRASPLLRTLYRGVLLPVAIVVLHLLSFGVWQFLRSETAASRRYGVEFTDREIAESLVPTVVNGVAALCRTPVLGDVLVANVLVVVLPTLALFPGVPAPCAAPACSVAAVFVAATTFACANDVVQNALRRRRVRDVAAAALLALLVGAGALLRSYYPQFAFGVVVTAALHALRFVDALAEFCEAHATVARAAPLDAARYPDYAEMQELLPPLRRAAALLRTAPRVVVYVGDEVARASGTSLRNLGLYARCPALARRLPQRAHAALCRRVVGPAVEPACTTAQTYVARLVRALATRPTTVVTECVDGLLARCGVPPAQLVELRGTVAAVACPARHTVPVDPAALLSGDAPATCPTCGLALAPAVTLDAAADPAALAAALAAVAELGTSEGSVAVVLGSCDVAPLRDALLAQHREAHVALVQISGGRCLAAADAAVHAAPHRVLFELVDELLS